MYFRTLFHRMEGDNRGRREDYPAHETNDISRDQNQDPKSKQPDQNQDLPKRKASNEREDEPEPKKIKVERFQIEEETNQWRLPPDLANYASKQLNLNGMPLKRLYITNV